MERFGFDPQKLPRNLSLTLGTAEATPLQMASAFAVFANGGYRIEPYLITHIEDARHQILEQASPVIVCPGCPPPKIDDPQGRGSVAGGASAGMREVEQRREQLPRMPGATDPTQPAPRNAEAMISTQNSFLMTSILRDTVSYGTAQAAKVLERNGYNSELVAISWIGFDQNQPLGKGETGGRAALPMWIDYMRVALDGMPEKPLIPPPGIVTAHVHRETGKPAAPGDPEAMQEYFMEGTVDSGTDVIEGGTGNTGPAPPAAENVREGLF
jgi:penicillin-binding protein 1A